MKREYTKEVRATNRRQRKKWLKQHKLYVEPRETWNMNITFARYIVPRLKKFKEISIAYPGRGEVDTPEKWDKVLDKMILAFEYSLDLDEYWIGNQEYDYTDYIVDKEDSEDYKRIKENKQIEDKRRLEVINEGLQLFAKYYLDLWW